MNLPPISVEYAHGDGARRPVNVGNKLDRADSVSCIGDQFEKGAFGRGVGSPSQDRSGSAK
jgi:hypothetical protein